MLAFETDLLKLLVCPMSKAALVLHEGSLVSTDQNSRRVYAIVDGIPDLLIAHSHELDPASWKQVMAANGRS